MVVHALYLRKMKIMSEDKVIIIGIFVLIILFAGEPDLMDGLIKFLSK